MSVSISSAQSPDIQGADGKEKEKAPEVARLRDDKEVVLSAIQQEGIPLESDPLGDKTFGLNGIRRCRLGLLFASGKLKLDLDLAWTATEQRSWMGYPVFIEW